VATTIIGVLVDESGSMEPTREKTISGVNEYLDGLVSLPGNVRLTLQSFNLYGVKTHVAAEPPENARHISMESYRPNGGTPLLDAMGSLIMDIERQAEKYASPKILVFVVTDGEENASREWSRDKLLRVINTKKEEGWAFAYLGADHDAFAQASGIGVASANTVTYAKGSEEVLWRSLSAVTSSYLMGKTRPEDLFGKNTSGG
jgi:uncharacterized protein YegL